ncbi:MAG TPA: hypothetical protein VIY56_16815 [Vicinamibacterales bacterium]
MLVDASDVEVGQVENLREGLVVRAVGNDRVLLQASPQGFIGTDIVFYHLRADCLGDRYLPNFNGPGFAFVGQVFGNAVVYSRVVDPRLEIALEALAQERVPMGSDIHALGQCDPMTFAPQSMGEAVIATDPAIGTLQAPFRLR